MTYRVLMVGIFCRSEIDMFCVAAGDVEQRQIYPMRFTTSEKRYLRKKPKRE